MPKIRVRVLLHPLKEAIAIALPRIGPTAPPLMKSGVETLNGLSVVS